MQEQREETVVERWIRVIWQKLVARANRLDEPSEAIEVVMSQQLEAIARTRADLAHVAIGQKRLEQLVEELEDRLSASTVEARGARDQGNEEFAMRAMRRAMNAESLATVARRNRDDVAAQRTALEALLEEMRAQYEQLKVRRESVRAMSTAARALADGHASMTPLGAGGSNREILLERAHATLADMRARAYALAELRKSGALDPVGASEFDARSVDDATVRDRLSKL